MINKHKDVPPKPLSTSQRQGKSKNKILSGNISGTIGKFPPLNNLARTLHHLAVSLTTKCYQQQESSKELIRGFINDIERIRSEYI